MRAIIDARSRGLPDAVTYYRTFPREPSPAGDIQIEVNKLVALTSTSLEVLLDAMLTAIAAREKELMIVCHAFRDDPSTGAVGGILIPMEPNTRNFAEGQHLEELLRIGPLIARGDAIVAMPETNDAETKAKLKAWEEFLTTNNIVNIQGQFTTAQAKGAYDNWLSGEATKVLRLSSVTVLRKLITKGNQVRSTGFSRLEFRACNVGNSPNALQTLAKYFGAKKVLAPKVHTFFLSPLAPRQLGPHLLASSFTDNPAGPFGGRTAERLKKFKSGAGETSFPFVLCLHLVCSCWMLHFVLRIWEVERPNFQWVCASDSPIATQWFLNLRVMPGASFGGGSFPLAGLWTLPTKGATNPFSLPNDSGYRDLIGVWP